MAATPLLGAKEKHDFVDSRFLRKLLELTEVLLQPVFGIQPVAKNDTKGIFFFHKNDAFWGTSPMRLLDSGII
jgi:hypothetical protein